MSSMKVFYDAQYVKAAHEFDTTRKAGWIAASLVEDPILGVGLVSPSPADSAELELIHDPQYVRAIRTGAPRAMAESQGFLWDPGLWDGVCASTGGVRSAALAALEEGAAGSLSSGLHHARHDHGAGFCTFNGLALAALQAKRLTAGRVLILDLDAHCGGGTYSLIQSHMIGIDHLDISLNRFDSYTPDAKDKLEVVDAAERYLPAIRDALARQDRCALVIYNAGMDGYEGCNTGGLNGITEDVLAQRERLVFDWAAMHGYPIAFVLAGGYVGRDLPQATLVRLHRLTLEAASNAYGGRGG